MLDSFSSRLDPPLQAKLHLTPEDNTVLRSISPTMTRSLIDNVSHPHSHSHGLQGQHVLTVDMFNKEQLNDIFNLAQTLRAYVLKDRPVGQILKVQCFPTKWFLKHLITSKKIIISFITNFRCIYAHFLMISV